MVSAFVEAGFDEVLWIDPYPTRLPNFSDFKRVLRAQAATATETDDRIHILQPSAVPIEPLPLSGTVNHIVAWRGIRSQLRDFAFGAEYCVLAVGRPSKLAEWAVDNLPYQRSFVYVLDNFPAFYRGFSRASMEDRMRAVCAKVTDVYCSSSQLAADMRALRSDATVVLNGYPTQQLPAPSPQADRHLLGYVGTIAQWFDWPLVLEIARALPHVTLRLIGPEFCDRPSHLPGNIEMLGELPNESIIEHVQQFRAGLIPFQLDALTAGVDPIKFYEYRSMGIPVWSTRFGEMQLRGAADGVTPIDQGANWRSLWDASCASPMSDEEVAVFRAEVDWSRRFKPVLQRSLTPRNATSLPTSVLNPMSPQP